MRTEQQVLKFSLAAIIAMAALGIGFGLISGSYSIMFDGMFSLVDSVMLAVSITVSGLIAKSASDTLSESVQSRFNLGFWHFEPLLLATNSLLMMSVAGYALFQAVSSLLRGGRHISFGPAVVYTIVVVCLTLAITTFERRANATIKSDIIAMDIKGWLMAGGVTGALMVAFIIGLLIEGTRFNWFLPYVDPAVLAVVALILLPVPFSTFRKAVSDILLLAPQEQYLRGEVIAAQVAREHDFFDHRVYASRQGRARSYEIEFYVKKGQPERPLEYWDDIRDYVHYRLVGDDPHAWVTIYFTTRLPETMRRNGGSSAGQQ